MSIFSHNCLSLRGTGQVQNSNDLAQALVGLGYEIRKANTGNYSENHQVHLFTEEVGAYKKLYAQLFDNRLGVNFDKSLGGRIFIRLGTQEVTRRGMKVVEMQQIAEFLDRSFKGDHIRNEVMKFNSRFGKIYYSFD